MWVKVSTNRHPRAFSMARSRLVNKERKLNRLTVREKLSILKRLENGERQCDIVKSTGVSKTVVGRIKKDSDKLRNIEKENSYLLNSKCCVSRSKYTKVDQSVYHWFVHNRHATDKRKPLPITRSAIQLRAKQVARELGLVDFNASNSWFQGWLSRYNLSKSVKLDDESVDIDLTASETEMSSTNSSDQPVLVSTEPQLSSTQHGTPDISSSVREHVQRAIIKHTAGLMDAAARLRDPAFIELVRNFQTAAKTMWNINS
jgi:Tc5 transposase DNA-binding domain/CENP-B N-terminal DNA-binding domain